MVTLSTDAKVYVNNVLQSFTLYKAGSAEKHSGSDDETLRKALQSAMNQPDNKKQYQGNNVYRVKINNGNGYVVYKTGVIGVNSAAIFHYHWHYNLDLPLTVD
jgi:hypothetical protein